MMATEMTQKNYHTLKLISHEMQEELKGNILPFWMRRTVDTERGGFYGLISNDLNVNDKAPKGGILNSRILWTFSAAYRLFNNQQYLDIAHHAFEFMSRHLWDKSYGGVFFMVDYGGAPCDERKHAYNLAFAIYGLSEYYRVTSRVEALEMAITIFNILEEHFKDKLEGGYIEALARDYTPMADIRLSDKEGDDIKTMNTHLHVLEAYTNLLRVWKDDKLICAQRELVDIMLTHIIDPQNHRFKLFFDEKWRSSKSIISYGHDIEGSWLLCEAADVLGDDLLKKKVYDEAVNMAYAVMNKGVDNQYGGIYYEETSGHLDDEKHWWPQAEAVVGFLNAYQITQDADFLEGAYKSWSFIKDHLVDKKFGEWFSRTDRAGNPDLHQPKVEPWKCPYHNSRACMEVFERVLKAHS